MALTWPLDQARGFTRNVLGSVRRTELGDVLPPSMTSTIRWGRGQFWAMLGYRSAYDQILASVVIGVSIAVLSLGLLTPYALIMLIPLLVGLARMIPAVNAVWPLGGGR